VIGRIGARYGISRPAEPQATTRRPFPCIESNRLIELERGVQTAALARKIQQILVVCCASQIQVCKCKRRCVFTSPGFHISSDLCSHPCCRLRKHQPQRHNLDGDGNLQRRLNAGRTESLRFNHRTGIRRHKRGHQCGDQITFASAVDAATVNTTNLRLTDPSAVAGSVAYSATTNTATFTPSAALPAATTVTVTVSGLTSGGTALAVFTSSFTTAAPPPTVQYMTTLYPAYKPTAAGQISVDTAGNVTVQLTGGTPNTSLIAQFCPGQNVSIQQSAIVCIDVGAVTTDASGNASATLKFPQPGQWVGDFQLTTSSTSTTPAYITESIGSGQSQTFLATLQPESTANGGSLARSTVQDPLDAGTVSYNNGALVVSVTGAAPNTTYDVLQSETRYMDSSGTYDIGEFTTDATGKGQLTVTSATALGPTGDLFELVHQTGTDAGFAGGFSIPK
jgi:hypothetical protein